MERAACPRCEHAFGGQQHRLGGGWYVMVQKHQHGHNDVLPEARRYVVLLIIAELLITSLCECAECDCCKSFVLCVLLPILALYLMLQLLCLVNIG